MTSHRYLPHINIVCGGEGGVIRFEQNSIIVLPFMAKIVDIADDYYHCIQGGWNCGGVGEATVPLAFTLFVGKGKGAKLRFKYKEYKTQKAEL